MDFKDQIKQFVFSVVLFVTLAACVTPVRSMEWSTVDGKTISGEFASKNKESVQIKKEDGEIISIPIQTLSKESKAFIESCSMMLCMEYSYLNDFAKDRETGKYAQYVSQNGVPRSIAFIVTSVIPKSNPEKAGICGYRDLESSAERAEKTTIFTLVDGKSFRKEGELRSYLNSREGEEIKLTVWEKSDSGKFKSKVITIKHNLVRPRDRKHEEPKISTDKSEDHKSNLSPQARNAISEYERKKKERYESSTATSKDGRFVMVAHTNVVYIPKGGVAVFHSFVEAKFDDAYPTMKFFEIDGNTEKISLVSSDENVLVIDSLKENDYRLGFKKAGEVFLTASVGKETASLKIKVVELPFAIGDSVEKVIESWGLPKSEEKYHDFVSWPDTKKFDGLIYSPEAGAGMDRVSHWKYKREPGSVIAIENDKIKSVSTNPDDSKGYSSAYMFGNNPLMIDVWFPKK